MAQLSAILEVAKQILSEAGRKGMHVNDIAKIACERCMNMEKSADEFAGKLSAALSANLKLKTSKPSFARVNWETGSRKGKPKQGWYRVKIDRSQSISAPTPPQVQTGYTGKGGEYAVISELLFWGYNASTMTVDDGIDIVASKDYRFFLIQVKTATPSQNGKFSFQINKNSFERYNSLGVYYIFVLRDSGNMFFVLPSSHIEYLIKSGTIGGTNNYSITIAQEKNKWTMNGSDIQVYLNAFAGIK